MQITVQMSQEEYKEFINYQEIKEELIHLRREKQFYIASIRELEQIIRTELPHIQLYRVSNSSYYYEYYDLKDKDNK